jgi:peptidoglycan/LPS O-acetylase OafA/YrhL
MNTTNARPPLETGYIPSLDGIRAVAVLIVLLSHAGLGHIVPGGLGVTVFFFLSGYLITTLITEEFQKYGTIHYGKFFIRRLFRLFPPLIIILAVAYTLTAFNLIDGGISYAGLGSQVFYLANYHQVLNWAGDIPNGTGILWSLAVEEHFYLIFPLTMLYFLNKLPLNKVYIPLILICMLILLWRCFLILNQGVSDDRIYYATDTRIDSIIFGCILALTKNPAYKIKLNQIKSKDYILISLALILLASTLLYRNDIFRQTLRYTLQGIALLPIFYYSIVYSNSILFSWLSHPLLKKIGIYSYCIYLVHKIVIEVLVNNFDISSTFLLIVFTSSISLIFAYCIDKYIDSYFRKLRKKWH